MTSAPTSVPRVLITTAFLRAGDAVSRALEEAGYVVEHAPDLDLLAADERAALLAEADALIAGTRPLTAEHLAAAGRLRIIVRTGVGYDNVDVAAASRLGIPVCITPGVNRQAVAEYVFALALAHSRHIVTNATQLAAGEWRQPTGRELAGRTLGVIGLGSIGKAVADMAAAFKMKVIAHDPALDRDYAEANGIESTSLSDLLVRADVVTLHLFLDDTTRNLIDARALSAMKPDALIINTSRGGIVDEEALAQAVRAGAIAGAAIDVFAEEPLPRESPLRSVDGILTTSHIAGATQEARAGSGALAADIVISTLNGAAPKHVVNPGHARRAAS
ncbi:phosphoglycerate dehydrogenase [Nonomuraea angiospora]|uniref:phosphoglycerate dehydrogenase n=1 Tax=Nonomuraea angiospora TaxID=46172 RepID=UPI0029A00B62|nr:phosphoglycerate dehydrogenase [Nonomuraea angiospora]MDX3100912.1 phosphoglycerate dehydrogenase [Nonomuraea angiospora]